MRLQGKRGRLRVEHKQEDFSPMEGVGNMADAMLVFACGLIVALMLSWSVDVSDQGIVGSEQTKYEVEDYDATADTEEIDDTDLLPMGSVYMDVSTGKYYVVEE